MCVSMTCSVEIVLATCGGAIRRAFCVGISNTDENVAQVVEGQFVVQRSRIDYGIGRSRPCSTSMRPGKQHFLYLLHTTLPGLRFSIPKSIFRVLVHD